MVTVVEAAADMPDSAARDELARLFRSLSASVVCSALIFEGDGFKAATVRALTTTINLVARQPFPHRVFATVADAAKWMGTYAALKTSAARIGEHVADARHSLDQQQSAVTSAPH